ncbi:diguanylate cyclase domain-containing protein [Antrihabitans cavernicola]|uniref:diguanylate cyclase domain-containing protein n=1 Tax=Antrihabitans cavernicola TaxID=2495913 RepID=UPI0016595B2A|nr:diguanylate cyclase [Spelaeibacter cavernicola]
MIASDDVARLAGAWWRAVSPTAFFPASSVVMIRTLSALLIECADAIEAESLDRRLGERIGADLIRLGLTNPDGLAHTMDVLAGLADIMPRPESTLRLNHLLGSIAKGYAVELRNRTLAHQEAIHHAMASTRQAAADALRLSDARFRVVFENAAIAILIGDSKGILLDANPTITRMFGRSVDELRGTSMVDFVQASDRADVLARVASDLAGPDGGSVRFDSRYPTRDGVSGWVSLTLTRINGAGAADSYILAVGQDVTERRQLQDELHHQSRHDPLTGIPNRLMLRERLIELIDAAGTDDRIGLCFLDLDDFKDINDRHGHSTGDRLLAEVASRLHTQVTRDGNLVARIGGDEFVVLIPSPPDDDAVVDVAASLFEALNEPLEADGRQFSISASIGMSAPRIAGTDPDALLDDADTGMYQAKARGRGQWVMHNGHNGVETFGGSVRPERVAD